MAPKPRLEICYKILKAQDGLISNTEYREGERMSNRLFRFYSLFILISVSLFSCENRVLNHERKAMDQDQKQDFKPKKPSRHYSRSSNLC